MSVGWARLALAACVSSSVTVRVQAYESSCSELGGIIDGSWWWRSCKHDGNMEPCHNNEYNNEVCCCSQGYMWDPLRHDQACIEDSFCSTTVPAYESSCSGLGGKIYGSESWLYCNTHDGNMEPCDNNAYCCCSQGYTWDAFWNGRKCIEDVSCSTTVPAYESSCSGLGGQIYGSGSWLRCNTDDGNMEVCNNNYYCCCSQGYTWNAVLNGRVCIEDSSCSTTVPDRPEISVIYAVFLGFALLASLARCGACVYAHSRRQQALSAARRGEEVPPPPDNCCLLWCCGSQIIYYWEGVSGNCLVNWCIWPYFACCCWSPTPGPLDGGKPVVMTAPRPVTAQTVTAVAGDPPSASGAEKAVGHIPLQPGIVVGNFPIQTSPPAALPQPAQPPPDPQQQAAADATSNAV